VRDAATLTKLQPDVLMAIEENDFARLPSGMYRKAYIRTLAVEVGLDPNDIAAQYSKLFEPPRQLQPDASRSSMLHDQLVRQLASPSRPSLITLAVLVALAVAWFMLHSAPAQEPIALDSSTRTSAGISDGEPSPTSP
jgi:cytoskeletal protein RodZ